MANRQDVADRIQQIGLGILKLEDAIKEHGRTPELLAGVADLKAKRQEAFAELEAAKAGEVAEATKAAEAVAAS